MLSKQLSQDSTNRAASYHCNWCVTTCPHSSDTLNNLDIHCCHSGRPYRAQKLIVTATGNSIGIIINKIIDIEIITTPLHKTSS